MSPDRCRICGTEDGAATPVVRLRAVAEAGRRRPLGALRICQACIDRREAKRWAVGGVTAQRLAHALATHPHKPSRRFAYLSDEARWVHLVRIRSDWIRNGDAVQRDAKVQ